MSSPGDAEARSSAQIHDQLAGLTQGAALQAVWAQDLAVATDLRQAVTDFLENVAVDFSGALALETVAAIVEAVGPRPWLLSIACRTAIDLDDLEAAGGYAELYTTQFPKLIIGLRLQIEVALAGRRTAAAEKLLDGVEDATSQDWALRARATILEQRQSYGEMLEVANQFRTKFPDNCEAWLAQARALARLGRHAEAKAVLTEAPHKFVTQAAYIRCAADIAVLAEDIDLAVQYWIDLRRRYRDKPDSYLRPIQPLMQANRMEFTGPIVAEGLARFPNDVRLLKLAAQLATRSRNATDAAIFTRRLARLEPGDAPRALAAAVAIATPGPNKTVRLAEALRRLTVLNAQYPDFAPGYSAHIRVLKDAGELDRAQELSRQWCDRFPDDVDMAMMRIAVLEDLGDTTVAVEELQALLARMPNNQVLQRAYIRELSLAGEHDRAEAEALAAYEQNPNNRRFFMEWVHTATRRGDWALALERLEGWVAKYPGDEAAADEIRTARLMLADGALLEGGATDPAQHDLAIFESLGGSTVGCEIAMAQRHFGYDSIGLLRWSNIIPAKLITALQTAFEGVGDEENMVLSIKKLGAAGDQYRTLDKRYGMHTHTFVKVADAPYDKMFVQSCRRLKFLRGKLLEDLSRGEKIFAYKAVPPVADKVVRQMAAAVNTLGGRAFLCVMQAERGSDAGTVRVLAPGVYVGYVAFVIRSGAAGVDIPHWRDVLRTTARLWREENGIAEPAAA
jgi:tetratricopeptide (TPR) repeat protein